MDGHHVEQGNQNLRLIACPHLFSIEKDRIDRMVPAGATVTEHLRAIGWQPESVHARVWIDGVYVEQAQWEYAVPRAGQSVVARAIPMGGGGGQGKQIGQIVALVAILAATWYVGGGGLGAFLPEALGMAFSAGTTATTVLAGATFMGGYLAFNGLIPAPRPRRALPQPMPEPRRQVAA